MEDPLPPALPRRDAHRILTTILAICVNKGVREKQDCLRGDTMLSILKKFFGVKTDEEVNANGIASKKLTHTRSPEKKLSPLDLFRNSASKSGDPDCPFLSKDYSPSSRVPSTDLTPFIIERLRQGDERSVTCLMHEILSANPGLGTGPEWIDTEINQVMTLCFEEYVTFADRRYYDNIRALWIVVSKGGGGREFWITDETPQLFSWALCCYLPDFTTLIVKLAEKANRFISKMAKDTPFWKEYPRLQKNNILVPPLAESELIRILQQLSISARLHFFRAASMGGGSLPRLTTYPIRSFGISVDDTSTQLEQAGLFLLSAEPESLNKSLTKQELLEACAAANVEVRKSWNKDKMAQVLYDNNPDYFRQLTSNMHIVKINPVYEHEIKALTIYATSLVPAFKALCFL